MVSARASLGEEYWQALRWIETMSGAITLWLAAPLPAFRRNPCVSSELISSGLPSPQKKGPKLRAASPRFLLRSLRNSRLRV